MSVKFSGGPSQKRPAYADWERETRPEHAKDKFTLLLPFGPVGGLTPVLTVEWPLFRPVYVRVKGATNIEIADNADVIKRLGRTRWFILLGDDADQTLGALIQSTTPVEEVQRYFFAHILERPDFLYLTGKLFDVVHVGPAVPGLSAGRLRTTAAKGVQPMTTVRSDPAVVVTAIIDIEIGIGHERFRLPDGKTRVRHFWRQKRESYSGLSGLTIGREFNADAIDTLLTEAGGDEQAFYALLSQGRYGSHSREKMDVSFGPPSVEDLVLSLQERAQAFYGVERTDEVERTEPKIEPTTEPPISGDEAGELESLLTNSERTGQLRESFSDGPPYLMSERPLGIRAGHGTWVADIAAGFPMEEAPQNRPIVAVELPDYAVADTAGQRLEVFVLMGLRRILNWCDNWNGIQGNRVPVVVNLSLGNTAGPKDGTGFLETEIARLVDARNRAGVATRVVMAAGNAYRERLTAVFDLARNARETIDWRVQADDRSPSFLEIRLPAGSAVAVTITAPGESALTVMPGKDYDLMMDGDLAGRIYQTAPLSGDRTITVALAPTQTAVRQGRRAPAGIWKIGCTNAGAPARVRLDVQRDDGLSGWPAYGRQSWLDHPDAHAPDPETGVRDLPEETSPVVRTHTLSAHATGSNEYVRVVGGAVALDGSDAAHWKPTLYTASGPDFSDRTGPDLSAVSEDGPATPGLRAAGFMSGSTAVFSGTSGAAPQVTRALVTALLDPAMDPFDLPGDLTTSYQARLGDRVLTPTVAPGRVARRRHRV
jgi:hypothetical protein